MHYPLLFLISFSLTLSAQKKHADITEIMSIIDSSFHFKSGFFGCTVMDANSGEILLERNKDKSFTPASTIKVLTTAAMLQRFGPTHQFKTELLHDGSLTADTLKGNLILKGYGDPGLCSKNLAEQPSMEVFLNQLAADLYNRGVRVITGKVIADASYFGSHPTPPKWQYDDLGLHYGAAPTGLIINENRTTIILRQQPEGQYAQIVESKPEMPYLRLISEVICSQNGEEEDLSVYAMPFSNALIIRGKVRPGSSTFSVNANVLDIEKFAAYHLKKNIELHGIKVMGGYSSQTDMSGYFGPKTILKTIPSTRLDSLLTRANHESINLYCEVFLKHLGLTYRGSSRHPEALAEVTNFWKNRGLETNGLDIEDGSGLSPRNGISPLQLAKVLQIIHTDNSWAANFKKTLPLAGVSGTLKALCVGSCAQGTVNGKSGSMNKVRCYVGYTFGSKSGKQLIFSVMANRYNGSGSAVRKLLEKFMIAVSECY